MEALFTGMLAYVEGDKEIREDTCYVEGDEDDNGVMAPLAGQELLQATTCGPDQRVFAVDGQDVFADVVRTLGEGGKVWAVGGQEGCADSGWGAGFYIAVHGVARC